MKSILKLLFSLIFVIASSLLTEFLQIDIANGVEIGHYPILELVLLGVLYFVATPLFQTLFDIESLKYAFELARSRSRELNRKVANLLNNYFYSEETFSKIMIMNRSNEYYGKYVLSVLCVIKYVVTCVIYIVILSEVNSSLIPAYVIMFVLCYVIKFVYTKKQIDTELANIPEDQEAEYFCEVLIDAEKMRDIKLSNYEDSIINKGKLFFNRGLKKRYKLRRENGLKYPIMKGLITVILTVSFAIGIFVANDSLGEITAMISVFLKTLYSIDPLMEEIQKIIESKGYISETNRICEEIHEVYNKEGIKIESIDNIRFEKVSFAYKDEENVISGLNFEWNRGERLCIVGENGAGKTTFLKLLLGINQPSSGTIYVNGIDLKQINYASYVTSFGVCMQNGARFKDSVKNNVLFDKTPSNNEWMNLLAFAKELPEGMDTIIGFGEKGTKRNLSGGEWQKILLARAFCVDKDILVFDEPTAALDLTSEQEFYSFIESKVQKYAMIYVTHRLGFAGMSTKIAVMKNGTFVEEGTHEELLNRNGIYAKMFSLQRKMYE